jgi:hypothetical protein
LEGGALTDLLLLIADQANGLDVAFEILYSRLILDSSTNREHEPKLLEAGRDLLQRIEFRRDNNQDYRSAELVKSCLADPNANSIAARIALRLRSTVASHETSRFDNFGVLAALLEVQPVAVLDALFAGDENDQRAGLRVLAPFDEEFAAAADVITCDALLCWCEGDRERRYPLAAWIITFGHRPEAGGPLDWSEKAKALLANAPDPRSVLEALINRFFRLRSLGGSRATLLEANAQLLDRLESHIPSGLLQFVNDAKAQLMREIARERQRETDEDRSRDERFEW